MSDFQAAAVIVGVLGGTASIFLIIVWAYTVIVQALVQRGILEEDEWL